MKIRTYTRTYRDEPESVGFSVEARTPADVAKLEALLKSNDDEHRLVITSWSWSSDGRRGFSFAMLSLKEIEDLKTYREMISKAEAEYEATLTGKSE